MPKVVGKILVDIIPEQHLWKIKLFHHWNSIIGNMKGKVRIEKLTENSLVLGVCHATWAQELFFLSPMIKKKINTLLKEEKIKNIRFKTVTFESQKKCIQPKKDFMQPKTQKSLEHCLTITEHGTLEAMNNAELATALEQFYVRCKKIKRGKT